MSLECKQVSDAWAAACLATLHQSTAIITVWSQETLDTFPNRIMLPIKNGPAARIYRTQHSNHHTPVSLGCVFLISVFLTMTLALSCTIRSSRNWGFTSGSLESSCVENHGRVYFRIYGLSLLFQWFTQLEGPMPLLEAWRVNLGSNFIFFYQVKPIT